MTTMGKINLNATGTTFQNRQGGLWNLRKHSDGAYITLRREKNNDRDKNAIAVIAHAKGTKPSKVGYVPADKALWLAPRMDNGQIVKAYHPQVVGYGKKLGLNFDIVYDIAKPIVSEDLPAQA